MSQCEPGTCWAESLGEACDHWKSEVERLRLQGTALENAGMETAAKLGEAEGREAKLARLLTLVAQECMTDEPDIVWIGAAAATAVGWTPDVDQEPAS